VKHFISGNVVGNPKVDEHKIEVCEGTNVSITITDSTGIPFVTTSTSGISCSATALGSNICTIINLQSKQRYRVRSGDTKDKDNMTILVISDDDLKDDKDD
jgi:hypothetical protein